MYQVQNKVIGHIKEKHSEITKLYYFSDGCSGQYKNCKKLVNLCHHQEDFSLEAECFFATSHGKSPSDGIGCTVKRLVGKRSLQRSLKNQILDYKSMIDLCREEINEIVFFYISHLEMINICENLQNRFEKVRTLPGTRSFHHFVPQSNSKISYKITSYDEFFSGSFNFFNENSFQLEMKMITIGKFVSCIYDTFWWIGMAEIIDEEAGYIMIKFPPPWTKQKLLLAVKS